MSTPTTATTQPRVDQRRFRLVGAVAAALALVVGGAAIFGGLGSGDQPAPLVLTANGGDAMASCLPFDVTTLAGMSPAFAGTVTELTDSVATIEVDRWFTGGDAEIVELNYTPGFEALIGTPALEVGQRYLITASNGAVTRASPPPSTRPLSTRPSAPEVRPTSVDGGPGSPRGGAGSLRVGAASPVIVDRHLSRYEGPPRGDPPIDHEHKFYLLRRRVRPRVPRGTRPFGRRIVAGGRDGRRAWLRDSHRPTRGT